MESMVVTESETIEREIDISNDIREGEENVYGSPIPDPRREAARSDNEDRRCEFWQRGSYIRIGLC